MSTAHPLPQAAPPEETIAPAAEDPGVEARWALSSPLRAAASWVFLLAALVAVNATWTYSEIHRRTERDVRAVRASGTPIIRYERRAYTQDEIVAMLRARRWRAALPLGGLALLLLGCGVLALRRPRAGTLAATGLTLLAGAIYLEVAPRITPLGVGYFLFLVGFSAIGVRGARGYARLQRGPPDALG